MNNYLYCCQTSSHRVKNPWSSLIIKVFNGLNLNLVTVSDRIMAWIINNYLLLFRTSFRRVRDPWRPQFLCWKKNKSIFVGLNLHFCNRESENHGMNNYLYRYQTYQISLCKGSLEFTSVSLLEQKIIIVFYGLNLNLVTVSDKIMAWMNNNSLHRYWNSSRRLKDPWRRPRFLCWKKK